MNNNLLLQCCNLCKKYQEGNIKTEVLHNVSFNLYSGEMISIVGISGSGKSTLLHLLGGLDKPTSGDVIFNGKLIHRMSSSSQAQLRNRELGFIYQFHHLLLDFNVLENVAMPMLICNTPKAEAKARAYEILSIVGLENHVSFYPSDLSGGERQRVAIARALVNHPRLVMADEPTGNLDTHNADNIFKLLIERNIYHGTAFLVVTHDIQLAKRFNRQMEMHDGYLRDYGAMNFF